MQQCPKCGKNAISIFEKLMLGPGRTISCPHCKTRLSVSIWTWIGFVVVFFTTRIASKFVVTEVVTILTTVLMIIYLYIHYKYVPLEIKIENRN